MKIFQITKLSVFSILLMALALPVVAENNSESKPSQILIKNVNIFDGKSDKLAMAQDLLVEGNLIKQIGKGLKASDKATVKARM